MKGKFIRYLVRPLAFLLLACIVTILFGLTSYYLGPPVAFASLMLLIVVAALGREK